MKVITVTNQKGGTGKTTTSLFLKDALIEKGKKVLLIDLDQQADASYGTGVEYDPSQTTYELLTQDLNLDDILVHVNDQLDLAPAGNQMAKLDVTLTQDHMLDAQFILSDKLEDYKNNYDYVIIDTPPALSMAVMNALTASDTVVVPTQADLFSLKGLGDLGSTVAAIKRRSNPKLTIAGILIGRYNSRTIFSKAMTTALTEAAESLQTHVFETKIREAISVKESQNAFQSIFEYDPKSKVTHDISDFVDELLGELENE